MGDSTTEQVRSGKIDCISGRAWLYIAGALGLGMLAGLELGATQMQGWKDIAGDWKATAQQYKTASEQNAGYANRWELEANKALALVARCTAPSIEAK